MPPSTRTRPVLGRAVTRWTDEPGGRRPAETEGQPGGRCVWEGRSACVAGGGAELSWLDCALGAGRARGAPRAELHQAGGQRRAVRGVSQARQLPGPPHRALGTACHSARSGCHHGGAGSLSALRLGPLSCGHPGRGHPDTELGPSSCGRVHERQPQRAPPEPPEATAPEAASRSVPRRCPGRRQREDSRR